MTDREGLRIFVLFWVIIGFGVVIYLRFADLDMTNARFLVTYWYVYVPMLLGVGVYNYLKVTR